MVTKMKTSGVGTSIIAREMALDIGEALYTPNVAEHLPGIANVVAGHLSRMGARGSSPLPAQLRGANQRRFPERAHSGWRSLEFSAHCG